MIDFGRMLAAANASISPVLPRVLVITQSGCPVAIASDGVCDYFL